ncbi:flagellar assembly protein FliW [Tumebacillus sp. ITR2]|uniref:Flagellar assembly factor FliW n=1 Tax=Tumebacillus amylolyticus TaxID=2801339 RepID=A0ABS1J5F1_9BACL|nr:flagellar assembly protein FliW [Tumebacillus amylolyticus]MBL0385517.1 flagellar assembly protein FliW [Tumebacillus amylolyticus]
MEIASVVLGKLEVEGDAVLTFADGLYGFEVIREYVLVQTDATLPFAYMQAKDEPGICLLVADPFVFNPSYEFDLSAQDTQALGNPAPSDLQIWVTVTTEEEMEQSTMNLLAPLVLNTTTKVGRQVVLHESGYQSRTPMFPKKEAE